MKKYPKLFFILLLINISCKKDEENIFTPTLPFEAFSTAYLNNGDFPQKYTCDGLSVSPPISWKNVPANTKGFAITMHHIPPTGEKHVYMCVYNIPISTTNYPENTSNIGLWGINTVNGKNSYTPPCSQGPGAKVYIITVYALSEQPTITTATNKVTMDVLLDAISNKTIAKSTISVTYSRP
ncbi:MAG: YbhB/YbcL family Raf kinase inhibitor-like protein [Aquirufa sp.]